MLNVQLVSGYGSAHTDKEERSFTPITLEEIQILVDNPQQVDKARARWFIPSSLMSRTFKEQHDSGTYYALWADFDTDPSPISAIYNWFEGYTFGMADAEFYTTASATPERQKSRLIVPLASPLDGETWQICQRLLNNQLALEGFIPDAAAERAAQLCYLPNRGDFYDARSIRGSGLFDPKLFWAADIDKARAELRDAEDKREADREAAEAKRLARLAEGVSTPIDRFNAERSVEDILEEAGYESDGSNNWRHPGSESGSFSARVFDNGRVMSLSPNDPLYNAENRAVDAFGAYSILFHEGDQGKALGAFLKQQPAEDLADAFEVLPSGDVVILSRVKAGEITRSDKGAVIKCVENYINAVLSPDICGYEIGYDEFKQSVCIYPRGDSRSIVILGDHHITDMRRNIFNHEKTRGLDILATELNAAVQYVAHLNRFDSLQLAVSDLPAWDGVPRVEESFITYFGAEDTPYIRELGKAWWTGLLGRAIRPGCFLKLVPIAMGSQDIGKSRTIRAMCLLPTHFKEIDFAKDNKDLCVSFQGAIVGEIAELAGFKGKSLEHLKKIISQQSDSWRPPYARYDITANRRICFFGTTNDDTFLSDPSGESRWFPFVATKGDYKRVEADVGQLWAEAKAMYEAHGIMYADAKLLAAPEQAKFKDEDPWESTIANWLSSVNDFDTSGVPNGVLPFTTSDVLSGALMIPPERQTSGWCRRAAAVLKGLGYAQNSYQEVVERNGVKSRTRLWRNKEANLGGAGRVLG